MSVEDSEEIREKRKRLWWLVPVRLEQAIKSLDQLEIVLKNHIKRNEFIPVFTRGSQEEIISHINPISDYNSFLKDILLNHEKEGFPPDMFNIIKYPALRVIATMRPLYNDEIGISDDPNHTSNLSLNFISTIQDIVRISHGYFKIQ